MKKLFITFCILLLCVSISGAGNIDKLKAVIAAKNAGEAVSYDFEETFETDEYDNVACGTAPCVTEANTPNGQFAVGGLGGGTMDGSYCLELNADDTLDIFFPAADQTSVWMLGKFNFQTNDGSEIFFQARGSTTHCYVYLRDVQDFIVYCEGAGDASPTSVMVPDTDIWLKFEAKEGTGSDGYLEVAYWTGAAWSAWYGHNTSEETNDLTHFRLDNTEEDAGEDQYWDSIKIKVGGTDPFTGDPSTY